MRIVSVHFMLIPFRATLYAEMSARFQRKCREPIALIDESTSAEVPFGKECASEARRYNCLNCEDHPAQFES
jgi:hypothetical protein